MPELSENIKKIQDKFKSIENSKKEEPEFNNREAKGKIEKILSKNYDLLKSKKEEVFLNAINEKTKSEYKGDGEPIQFNDIKSLPTENRIEFDNFELSEEDRKALLDGTMKEIKAQVTERTDLLNGTPVAFDENGNVSKREEDGIIPLYQNLLGEIEAELVNINNQLEEKNKELLDKENRINEIDKKLSNTQLDENERKQLEDEKKQLEDEKSNINTEIESSKEGKKKLDDMKEVIKGKEDKETGKYKGGRIQKLIDDHERSKQNAIKTMSLIYGPDLVFQHPDIGKIEPKEGKVAEQYTKMKEELMNENKEPVTQEQVQSRQNIQQNGAYVQDNINQQGGPKIMYAGGQVAGENINGQQEPSQQGNSVGTQEVEQVEEDKFARFGDITPAQEALTWIGYDAKKTMNVRNAKALLKNFAREESRQMDILKDPKAAKVIFDAMDKVDKAKFFQKIGFGKTKKALLKAANEFLPKAAAQEYLGMRVKKGEELKEYDKIMKEYKEKLDIIKAEKGEKDYINSPEYQELNEKYASVLSVSDFREKTNQYLNKDKNILPEAKEDIKEEDKFKDFSEEEKAEINELQEKINNMSYRDLNRMVLDLKEKGDKTTLSYINSGLIDLNGGQQKHFEAGMDGKKTDRTLLEHIKDASAEVEKEKEDKKNEFISTLTEKTENSAEKEADILEKINKNKISVEEYKKLPPDLQKKVKNNIQKSISEGELSKGEREVSEYINYEDTKEWAKTQENRNKDDKEVVE